MNNIAEILLKDLQECRNELCFRCGNYIGAHLGDCDGCKWKDYDFDELRKAVVVNSLTTGKWIRTEHLDDEFDYVYKTSHCSNCGELAGAGAFYFNAETPYCHQCGAKMIGTEDGGMEDG